jgi:hypothetical protein
MIGTNKVLVENLKILAKIFPVKKIQIYNNEATIVLHTNDFLDGLLFLKNNILCQFKIISCISEVDDPANKYRFKVVYDLLSIRYNCRLRVKIFNHELVPVNSCEKVEPSETTRGTLSDNSFNPLNLDLRFKYWFIGFTEGDGSFIVDNRGSLTFVVTQSSVDVEILFYIQNQLKFGFVRKQCKASNTHRFRVGNQKDILKLIHIFNGNLLTEKNSI